MALEPITRQEQIIAGKDLEPITRMERFLKEYGGGGGGGAVQSVNGKTGKVELAYNDLKDRPFWEEVTAGEVTVIHRLDPKYIGYDAVINVHSVENNGDYSDTATLLEGSYDAIVEKLKNDELVRVKVIVISDYIEGDISATEKIITETHALLAVNNLTNEKHVGIDDWELLPDGTLILK